jgi:hypothetical protein
LIKRLNETTVGPRVEGENMMRLLAAMLLCAGLVGPAVAQLSVVDLPDDDKGFGYFLDQGSGRTWMDVDNFLGMSFNDVVQALDGTNFRVATLAELSTFVTGYPGLLGASRQDNVSPFSTVASIMGQSSQRDIIHAFYDSGIDPVLRTFSARPGQGFWSEGGVHFVDSPLAKFSYADADLGAFVIQDLSITPPIPEPEIYAMLLAGVALLGREARRRKRLRGAAA